MPQDPDEGFSEYLLLFIVIIVQPRNTVFPFHKNIIWLHRNHKEIMAEN